MNRLVTALLVTACSATAALAGDWGYGRGWNSNGYGYYSRPHVDSVYVSRPYTTSVYVTEDYPWYDGHGYRPNYKHGYSYRPRHRYGYSDRPRYGYGSHYRRYGSDSSTPYRRYSRDGYARPRYYAPRYHGSRYYSAGYNYGLGGPYSARRCAIYDRYGYLIGTRCW